MNFSIENSNLEGGFSDISDRGFKGQNAPGLQEARGGENSIEEQGSLEER